MLKLDLQFFNGDPDLDALRASFEQEYQEPETETVEEEVVDDDQMDGEEEIQPEPEEDTDPSEVVEETDSTPDVEEIVEEQPKKQSREENKAFAEMRRKNQELEKQARIAEQIAAQYGMTVEQFEKAFQEKQEQERAEKQGIPVEILRRLEAAEQQLQQTQIQAEQDKFWNSVEKVKAQHNLDKDDLEKVYKYIGENGLVNQSTGLPLIDFEQAYKLANFDTLQERKTKEAVQKQLADKKARQQKSAIPHTNANTTSANDEDFSLDDVEKRLRARNLL